MIYYISNQQSLFPLKFEKATIQDAINYFFDKNYVEVDTETEFCKWNKDRIPDPYTSKVLCLQLGNQEHQYIIDIATVDISLLKPLFANKAIEKILCNAFFDLRFFHHWGFKIRNVWDIFLVESIIHKGKELPKGFRGLQGMADRYLNKYVDKTVRGQIHWRGLDESVIEYAAGDVTCMWLIKQKQLELINSLPINIQKYIDLENRYVIDLSLMSYHGINIDPFKWLEVKNENIKRQIELVEIMANWLVSNKMYEFATPGLFGNECTLNFNSSKQMIPLLKKLGVNVLVRDKEKGGEAMKESTDLKGLKKQINKSEFLQYYIEYKELGKEISTYGEEFLKENINPISKRIHSEFFQILDTSRISSNNPNMQNIPGVDSKGEVHKLRKSFTAPKGKVLIDCDFSQQEPRITADFCQDPVLLDFVLNGDGDSHSFVSTLISEKLLGEHVVCNKKNNPIIESYGKRLRDIGKMINLGLDYGKTAFTLKDDLNCSQEAAQELLDFLKSRTPLKEKYFEYWRNFVKNYGFIISDNTLNCITYFYKYDRYLELKKKSNRTKSEISEFYKIEGELERFSQNNRIQNTGALMSKTAHILINDKFEELGYENRAKVVNMVHDECLVESDEEISEEVARIMSECMVKSGTFFCNTIPMKAEPIIAYSWDH